MKLTQRHLEKIGPYCIFLIKNINHITKGVIMKKQLLLTVLLATQALPAFQKDFFNAIREIIDAAEERLNNQSSFFHPAFKERKQSSSITLSADENGVTALITNAPYDQAASTRADKHMLVLKHPSFTVSFKEGALRRRNDNVYALEASISSNQTEEIQDEQRTSHASYSSFVERNIILPKPVDTSKATITYRAPSENQDSKKLGEYVFYFPYKEIKEQQIPIIVQQAEAVQPQ